MAGFLQRGILLYLFIAIAVCFAAPDVVFGGDNPAGATVLSWFNVGYDTTTNSTTIGNGFNNAQVGDGQTGAFETPTSPAGANGILGFIDPIFQVFNWVLLFFKVLFSPILLLIDPRIAMPTPLVLIFAVPLVLLFIVGLLTWIRSGFA